MSILKSSIVEFVEKAFEETSKGTSATTYNQALQAALDDISSHFEILRNVDTSQSLVVGGDEINEPSDMMPGGLIAITLEDAAGITYEPLQKLKGGLKEYRYLLDNDVARSRPEYFVEASEERKWFVWRHADVAYDVLIEYYRVHPQDVETILLPDVCSLPLKVIATYYEAVLRGNTKYQNTWQPHYLKQMQDLGGMFPGQVRGTYDP